MGLLRVKGTIDIGQFWPTGKSPSILSDADTVHVQIDPATSFVFEGNVTRAFDFSWIKTRKNKDGSRSPIYVIVSQRTTNAHIKGTPPGDRRPRTPLSRRPEKTGGSAELGQAGHDRAAQFLEGPCHGHDH